MMEVSEILCSLMKLGLKDQEVKELYHAMAS